MIQPCVFTLTSYISRLEALVGPLIFGRSKIYRLRAPPAGETPRYEVKILLIDNADPN
jgi:hypothetical protein